MQAVGKVGGAWALGLALLIGTGEARAQQRGGQRDGPHAGPAHAAQACTELR